MIGIGDISRILIFEKDYRFFSRPSRERTAGLRPPVELMDVFRLDADEPPPATARSAVWTLALAVNIAILFA